MNIYPNVRTNQRGAERRSRGSLRTGVVEENERTIGAGIAGLVAAVTREAEGFARAYVFVMGEDGASWWHGPHSLLSEEVDGELKGKQG